MVAFGAVSQQALGRRDVKAHVHGQAELTLVLDAKNLQVEAKIPMDDLVGFEHKPKTEKQKQALKQALDKLKDANKQLGLPSAASCVLKEATLEDSDHHHKHDKHDKHDKHHGHHKKHGKHDKHDKHHDKHDKHHDKHDKHHDKHDKHDDHGHEEHADIAAKYMFVCQKPAALDKIEINLFKSFPSLKKVGASFVGPKGQGHKSLTASDNVIELNKK